LCQKKAESYLQRVKDLSWLYVGIGEEGVRR
jgi:hypothetical protein